MTATSPSIVSGPVSTGGRALGPDLARGLMLLFIALANTHGFLHWPGVATIRNMPVVSSTADRIVAIFELCLVDGRSYTMFAALFGYGMVQIRRRQENAGATWPATRKLLRRRGWWLLGLGFLHAVLLYYGDILAAYALLALLLVASLRWSTRRLLIHAGGWIVAGALLYGLVSSPASPESAASIMPWSVEHNPLKAMGFRVMGIVVSAPILAITAAGAFLLGVCAARLRILEEPEKWLPLLRRVVWIGIPVSALGGLPLALYVAGVLPDPAFANVVPAAVLHSITGFAGGPAYAALIALWAMRLHGNQPGRAGTAQRPGRIVTALQATGQRSLTCYLSQSVVWAIVFPPYLLDLGHTMTLWQSALLAIGTWIATVLLADWMRRAGIRGPFEVLLRKLTYRKPA
ncbi:DUF418 domain-containing protein [Kribbella deserti]|uniref:DUF418 domain-containing protein n=1 Tax=Kribbella deserti TaxID=1926257 RepID=A0ABV6QG59_9ACTN